MKYIIEIGMASHAGSYTVGPFKSEASPMCGFDSTLDEEGRIMREVYSVTSCKGDPI